MHYSRTAPALPADSELCPVRYSIACWMRGSAMLRECCNLGVGSTFGVGYAKCGNYPRFLQEHELYFSQEIIRGRDAPVSDV